MDSQNILVVGAGGIGCELLKNLVLSGFGNISIVDLDTIELSNLNRQFLFRPCHIGSFKADVACLAIKKLLSLNHPSVPDNIFAFHNDISDLSRFPISFWTKHTLVLNALDNVEARRYVSQKCNSLQIPLVESGTAGYLGQCSVHLKNLTECWECNPKEPSKTYPTCTIRNTPTKPIHCVIWAKEYLYPLLFDDDSGVDDNDGNGNGDGDVSTTNQKDNDENNDKRSMDESTIKNLSKLNDDEFSRKVFQFLFITEIERISSYKELWTTCRAPEALSGKIEPCSVVENDDHRTQFTINELMYLFGKALLSLRARPHYIPFDKDDVDAMKFIYYSSLLRAKVYGITFDEKDGGVNNGPNTSGSLFAVKSLAGNIIPAIATTNAIVAAMITCQAINIINDFPKRNTFLCHGIKSARYLWAREDPLEIWPNPHCTTCQVDRALIWISNSFSALNLADLLELVRKEHGSLSENRNLSIIHKGSIIYDEEDVPLGLDKSLGDLGIADSSEIFIDQLDKEDRPALIVMIAQGEGKNIFSPLPEDQLKRWLLKNAREEDEYVDVDEEMEYDGIVEQPPTKQRKVEIQEKVIY